MKEEIATLKIQNFVRGTMVQQAAQVQRRLLDKLKDAMAHGQQLNQVCGCNEMNAAGTQLARYHSAEPCLLDS